MPVPLRESQTGPTYTSALVLLLWPKLLPTYGVTLATFFFLVDCMVQVSSLLFLLVHVFLACSVIMFWILVLFMPKLVVLCAGCCSWISLHNSISALFAHLCFGLPCCLFGGIHVSRFLLNVTIRVGALLFWLMIRLICFSLLHMYAFLNGIIVFFPSSATIRALASSKTCLFVFSRFMKVVFNSQFP